MRAAVAEGLVGNVVAMEDLVGSVAAAAADSVDGAREEASVVAAAAGVEDSDLLVANRVLTI